MKIVVCVKQVPSTDNVKFNSKTGTLMRNEVPGNINKVDIYAVSMAVQFAKEMKQRGEVVSVTAITMGPAHSSAVLRESIAYGADDGVLLCDAAFAGADTWATSKVLAAAVRKLEDVSFIFVGKESTDGETGHIGPQIAEHLSASQITMSRRVWWNGRFMVERVLDGICEQLSAELPVVISVTKQAEVSKNLSIGNIYKAYDKKIFVWTLQDLELGKNEVGLAGSMTAVKKTFLPNSFAKGVILAGSVEEITEELVNELYDKHILRE